MLHEVHAHFTYIGIYIWYGWLERILNYRNRLNMNKLLGLVAIAAAVAIPATSFAQTFAYVNTAGEVMTVEAGSAQTAIITAPGIHPHSGVLLLSDPKDSIVGDTIR